MSSTLLHHPSSYRDPSGFIFEKEGVIYRQVNLLFQEHFDQFIQSGCYARLVEKGWLIAHEEVKPVEAISSNAYKIIQPERVSLISYPSEWSFDMLKDAALLTLRIAKEALNYNMLLKDATPLNVQWHKGKFVFIDTLSFEKYEPRPWIAYRQFCECFLGPLLLMHYKKAHLSQLYLGWPEGIPLQLLQSFLPVRSRFSLAVYLHIHLNAKFAAGKKTGKTTIPFFPKSKMLNLLGSLESLVEGLKSPRGNTNWSDYYEEAAERDDYLVQKTSIIRQWTDRIPGIQTAADLGANEGVFSGMLAEKNIQTIAADFDAHCINRLYEKIKLNGEKNIQPLILDLSNPTPATGVNNKERSSFIARENADLILALALIHHLSIGKNIPFSTSAELFRDLGQYLIIEFVPKQDAKVQLMLSQKKDIYPDYTEAAFTDAFFNFFTLLEKKVIPGTERVLYFLKRSGN